MRKFLHNDKKDIDSAIINTARRKNLPPALYNKPKIWTKNSKNSEFAVL